MAGDYTDYGDEVLRTTGTGGRVRSRVSIGEYNPDKVINARPSKLKGTFDSYVYKIQEEGLF